MDIFNPSDNIVPDTPENAGYVAAVTARINAETARMRWENRLMAAKAGLWSAAGFGARAVATGAAGCAILYGYSFVQDKYFAIQEKRIEADRYAAEHPFRVVGDVGIRPDAAVGIDPTRNTVALAPGATVALSHGEVTLAPNSSVTVKPDMHDLVQQMQKNSVPDTGGKSPLEINEVTAFQMVDFNKGEVVSGWDYHAADNFASPYKQFCYYRERDANDQVSHLVDLGTDHQIKTDLRNPFRIDMRAAFAKCVWHA